MALDVLRVHFQRLAYYNTAVNKVLLDECAKLSHDDLTREHGGSFGSVWKTLHHIYLADVVWLERFETHPPSTTRVDQPVCDDFATFRVMREKQDAAIERFVADVAEEKLAGQLAYRNLSGQPFEEPLAALLQHMLNHATHHRGQIHVMLSNAGLRPNFDMHRLIRSSY